MAAPTTNQATAIFYRIITSNGLTIGPGAAAPGPLFVTEPDRDGEALDEFIDPRSGAKIDAKTGEVL